MAARPPSQGGIQERISAPIPRRPRAKIGLPSTTSSYTPPPSMVNASPRSMATFHAGPVLDRDGTIQERMRWPTRTGTEVMRTVAARVNLTPSHYAMLGVPRDFTEAQLRKQYRLLAMRYHPDAADRNGIDQHEALERFTSLQTAYSVLSDPARRRRYDMESRLQHRREWRRASAWDGPTLLLTDKSGGADGGATAGEGSSSDNSDAEASVAQADRAEKARRWEAQRVEWLQQQLEAQQQTLSQIGEEARVREARAEEAEARRRQADAEHALRQEREKARRKKEKDKRAREADEQRQREQFEQQQEADEERQREVEARVRKQVEERARRHGAETARREAAEAVRACACA